MKGLDVSFSAVSLDWCRARYAEGWRALVQNLWTGGYAGNDGLRAVARNNLANAKAAGLRVAAYANASPAAWWPIAVQMQEIRRNAGDMWPHLEGVAVDVEIPGITLARVLELADAINAAGQRADVLYTARWFWTGHMGDSKDARWRRFKLWNAYYDGDPDIDFASAPYGPWAASDLVGEQYQGTTQLGGASVDLNTFLTTFLQPQEEDEMADVNAHDVVIARPADYATRLAANEYPREWGSASWNPARLDDGIWYLIKLLRRRDEQIAALAVRVAALEDAAEAAGLTLDQVRDEIDAASLKARRE